MTFWLRVDGALTRTAATFSDSLRDELVKAIDIQKIVDDWTATHPAGGTVTPDQAREWAGIHVRFTDQQVRDTLMKIYAAGYRLGSQAAQGAVGMMLIKKAPSRDDLINSINTDWSTWTPGGNLGAELVRPSGALQALLNQANVTIAGFNKTTINRLGTRLADALTAGTSGAGLARDLTDIVADPVRAYMIANTEMKRALSVGAMDNYQSLGVAEMEWMALDPCEICAEFDGEQRPIGESFGADRDGEDVMNPPAHPNCRCIISPVAEFTGDNTSDQADQIDLAATITKGVPGPLEVARALSRLEILPNPAHPELDDPEKFVESPWTTVAPPSVDPNLWDDAIVQVHELSDLTGTDLWLKRKKIAKHIEAMGQAITPFRSLALVAIVDGHAIIIDGHHRLMALWLLGQSSASAYTITIG